MTPQPQLTARQQQAYEIGTRYAGQSRWHAWEAVLDGTETAIDPEEPIEVACFEAGVLGHPCPQWVTGWRYGTIPASGHSRNWRDDRWEPGVSIMALDTDTMPQTDGTFALFNADRPRVRIGGWLIGLRGSDGERLVVGAQSLTPETSTP
jgi:hypothetical protein